MLLYMQWQLLVHDSQ